MVAPGRGALTPDVLVAGAGPTGLALALQAHAHGAEVRVVERREALFRPSRAMILHARTLEVLRPLGVAEDLLSIADATPRMSLHLGRREVAVGLTDLPIPDTAFPHLSLVRQMDVETVLAAALADHGVEVERGVEARCDGLGDGARPVVDLRSGSGVEAEVTPGCLVGCDGAASTVRDAAGIGWREGPYRQEVVLADLELDGDLRPGVAHVAAGRAGLLFVFPVGEQAHWRLLATRPATYRAGAGVPCPPVPAARLQELLDAAGLPVTVASVAWSSAVALRHGLADTYRRGRVLVAGDAAHVQSPAGGQGMNVGLQDAANLGWKLAYAPRSADPDRLLDSYEAERRPIARVVRGLTDVAFWGESSPNPLAAFARGTLGPLGAPLLPAVLGRRLVAEGVRVLSHLRVGYRGSPLSQEATTHPRHGPRAGDRLPDATVTVDGRPVHLHELTATPGVHLLLDNGAPEPAGCRAAGVHVHRLTNRPGTGLVAVRPDGYIGFRGDHDRVDELRRWLAVVGVPCAPPAR